MDSTYLATMAGDLRRAGETEERIATIASWPTSRYLTEAEQVALELLEASPPSCARQGRPAL